MPTGDASRVPQELHGAVSDFLVRLVGGLIDDDRWDWDLDRLPEGRWAEYQRALLDPTHLRSTIAVFMNNLRLDGRGAVCNHADACFRGFQYFRAYLGAADYTWGSIAPPLQQWEFEEAEPPRWEA